VAAACTSATSTPATSAAGELTVTYYYMPG
jgi:hypothetical protein